MAAEKLTDFKDWIAPMIVKELRQGTRTRVFSIAFILLQAALIIVMLTSIADRGASRETAGWFWFCIATAFMVVMPLRGFGAVANEMRMGTMDLILLTRQSSWRIMFGKWAALFSQTLLVAAALLPFVVIRYFVGGINMVEEVIWLLLLTINSAVFTALSVGMSGQHSVILRVTSALAIVTGGFVFFGAGIMDTMMRGHGLVGLVGGGIEVWPFLGLYALFALFATYYLLDMGATFFAPVAENHSTRKRLIALLFMGIVLGSTWFGVDAEFASMMAAIPMIVVMIDALTEHPAPVASVYVPFVRKGPLARIAGKFLYPGWQTGLIFTIIVSGILCWFIIHVQALDDVDDLAVLVGLVGTLIFPIVIKELLFSRYSNPFALYVFVQLIIIIAGSLLLAMDHEGRGGTEFLWYLSPIPFIGVLIAGNSNSYDAGSEILVLNCFSAAVCFLILFVKAFPIQRRLVELENVVAKMIAKERDALSGDAAAAVAVKEVQALAEESKPEDTEDRDSQP